MTVSVFVGTSVDGFIARPDGALDFLPEGGGEPHGYDEFIAGIDAIVMGRKTFETVIGFEEWPYGGKRVVVLSSRPVDLSTVRGGVVERMAGAPAGIVAELAARGARHLYVDGGVTIQEFLRAGVVDRLVITRVPVLIGSGIPLFGALPGDVRLRHVATRPYPSGLVQSEYRVETEPVAGERHSGAELFTERLHLRPFRAEDFEAHAAICADPEVMKYIRAGPLSRNDSWWQMARYMGHRQLRGYGLWAVVERATGRLIGHLGYLDPEGGHGFELGWALARDAWGKGYALEGTREAVLHAFTALERDRIVCLIDPANARSLRVAERLGAVPEGEIEESGKRLLLFAITRPAGSAPDRPTSGA